MGRILAIVNQKGGVGKTTSCISLAASLAARGKGCLIVDFDPQGNASSGLGIDKNAVELSTYELIIEGASSQEATIQTELKNLSIIPANMNLAGAEVELAQMEEREQRLKRALNPIRDAYDFILIDCPPSLGLLTLNALVATDQILVPIQAEFYALEGISQLMETVNAVRSTWNNKISIFGVLITMCDQRTQLARQVERELRQYYGDLVFRTVVPRNVRLSEAPSYGQPITVYDPRSRGAEAYKSLAREVIRRDMGKENGR